MAKTYKITAENTHELRAAMKEKRNLKYYRKLLAVALRGEGKNNEEAGEITGYHPKSVSALVCAYCNKGIASLLHDGRKGGNHRNMSNEEEDQFLEEFRETAAKGQVTTINEIASAYDEATGKERSSMSTVYYLLHKHGWRTVIPQTVHPGKASEEVIAVSKKHKK